MEKGTKLVQISKSSLFSQQGQGELTKKRDIEDIQFSLNQVKSLIEGKLSSFQKFLEPSNSNSKDQQQFLENTFASNKIIESHLTEIIEICHYNMNQQGGINKEKGIKMNKQNEITDTIQPQKPLQLINDKIFLPEPENILQKQGTNVRYNGNNQQELSNDVQFQEYSNQSGQQLPKLMNFQQDQQEYVYDDMEGDVEYNPYDREDEYGYQDYIEEENMIDDQYDLYSQQYSVQNKAFSQIPYQRPNQIMGHNQGNFNQNNNYFNQNPYIQQQQQQQNGQMNLFQQPPSYDQQFQGAYNDNLQINLIPNQHQTIQQNQYNQRNPQKSNFYCQDNRQYSQEVSQFNNGYVNSFNYQQKRLAGQPLRNKLEQEQRIELYKKFEQEHNLQIPKFFKSNFYLQKTPRSRFFQHLTNNEFYAVAQIYEKLGTQQQVAELLDTSVPNIKRILTLVKQQIECGAYQPKNPFTILHQQIK